VEISVLKAPKIAPKIDFLKNAQWEIGWLKVQEVILQNHVFGLFIR
jgi:hypothetical protein